MRYKEIKDKIAKLLAIKGTKTVDEFHRELGQVMWDYVGMSRNAEGLKKAIEMIKEIRRQFREIGGLLEGSAKPDTARCVDIATTAALKKMILPC